jgi:hypothetical protein
MGIGFAELRFHVTIKKQNIYTSLVCGIKKHT